MVLTFKSFFEIESLRMKINITSSALSFSQKLPENIKKNMDLLSVENNEFKHEIDILKKKIDFLESISLDRDQISSICKDTLKSIFEREV